MGSLNITVFEQTHENQSFTLPCGKNGIAGQTLSQRDCAPTREQDQFSLRMPVNYKVDAVRMVLLLKTLEFLLSLSNHN